MHQGGTTQPQLSAQHNETIPSLLILKENLGDKTAHALKHKAWTSSNPAPE